MAPRHSTTVLSVSTLGLAALLIAQGLTYAEAQTNGTANARQGKVFSLFNVVQFQNNGCRSTSALAGTTGTTSPYRNGTCYTAAECSSKGGQAAGQCAAGFGVCCVFIYSTSASTVSQNCSYIRNPGFPSAYAGTAAVTYTIQKTCPTVCSLRLDFEMFSTVGPAGTLEATSCPDSFTVTTATKGTIPTICGINTGQHIYIDMGAGSSDSATLNFAFTGTSTNRLWDIKVTQVLCGQPGSQPTGCLQWYTGITGRITTFNFATTTSSHLPNQDYSQCIRAEAGYCCIKYYPCADPNSFTLNGIGAVQPAGAAAIATAGVSGVDSLCSTFDYVGIAGSSGSCQTGGTQAQLFNKYCGAMLNTVSGLASNIQICDCTQPFVVGIFTDATTGASTIAGGTPLDSNRGVCLNYMQIPCTAT